MEETHLLRCDTMSWAAGFLMVLRNSLNGSPLLLAVFDRILPPIPPTGNGGHTTKHSRTITHSRQCWSPLFGSPPDEGGLPGPDVDARRGEPPLNSRPWLCVC